MKTSFSNRFPRVGTGLRDRFSGVSGLVLLSVLVLYPLLSLLAQTVFPHLFDVTTSFHPSLAPLIGVFRDTSNLKSIVNSLTIGIAAAVWATVLGTLTAFAVLRAPKSLATVLDIGVWVVMFSPSYVIAEGWLILMQDNGILAQLFGLPSGWSAWFFTRFGLILVMGLRYFPFVHLAMVQAIGNLGAEMTQAGRVLGARRVRIFFRILFPLLTPAWLAGASIAFAEGFGDFGFAVAITPQMQIPLLTYQIYSALYQAPVDYSAAAGLSLLEIAVTAGAIALQFWWMRKRSYTTVSGQAKLHDHGPRRATPLVYISLIITVASFVLPIGSTAVASLWKTWYNGLQPGNWTLQNYAQALQVGGDGLNALLRSLLYSLIVGVATMVIGLFIAYQLTAKKSWLGSIINAVTMSTIAIPGVVLAAGFVFAWNAKWLIPLHLVLYGTSTCLVLAYLAGSIPYAIRLQLGAFAQLSGNLVTAARLLGAGQWRVLWHIVLPLIRTSTLSTFFIAFTGTVFEMAASSLLYPPGEPPFPVEVQSKFNAFEWSQGSALTLLGMAIVLGLYALGRFLSRERKAAPATVPTVTERGQFHASRVS